MSPQRKRANAFEDFPGQESQPQQPQTPASAAPAAPAAPQVERIERLKPSQMLPDRFQPRRLLPTGLRAAFFGGQMDCYQAAAAWLKLAEKDEGYGAEIDRLLAMGDSFTEYGQIKPITGAWVSLPDGRYIFLIETGERRFWAACLQAVKEKREEEPLLRVEAITRPTRQRQVLENRHAELPSAVGQACEVAALILAEINLPPDPNQKEYDYFRKAHEQRIQTAVWERITPIMQLTRPRMVQMLNILSLPDPLLDLVDRYRLPERVLRPILKAPPAQWERLIRLSIKNSLTSDEVGELLAPEPKKPAPGSYDRGMAAAVEPVHLMVSGLRRFANAIAPLDGFSQASAIDQVADILVSSGEAEGVAIFLGELGKMIEARLSARRS